MSPPTIKYYLREGLLPPGELRRSNRADYGEQHLHRLRLIRALIDLGGLSVAGVRELLGAIDAGELTIHEKLGAAQNAITHPVEPAGDPASVRARAAIEDLVVRRGWTVADNNPGWNAAVDALVTGERLGSGSLLQTLEVYADAMEPVAQVEVEHAYGGGETDRVVEDAVLSIVLGGILLMALRSMAQEAVSVRLSRS